MSAIAQFLLPGIKSRPEVCTFYYGQTGSKLNHLLIIKIICTNCAICRRMRKPIHFHTATTYFGLSSAECVLLTFRWFVGDDGGFSPHVAEGSRHHLGVSGERGTTLQYSSTVRCRAVQCSGVPGRPRTRPRPGPHSPPPCRQCTAAILHNLGKCETVCSVVCLVRRDLPVSLPAGPRHCPASRKPPTLGHPNIHLITTDRRSV